MKKRMRLPNGFGRITKLKGRLRNPYRVMVTIGKDELGKPIGALLKPKAYFPTYNDAYAALVEYNTNPYDNDPSMTVKELYEKWSDTYFENISASSIRTIKCAWSYCSIIYDEPVTSIRARHIKYCMEEGISNGKKPTANIKSRIKSLFNVMLDYAVEYEIVDKNYARSFEMDKNIMKEVAKTKIDHIVYSVDEMNTLWSNITVPYVDMLLIQCYTGLRPQELCKIRVENVNINDCVIIAGMKTEAGTNRAIPIHSRIYELVRKKYNRSLSDGDEYLFGSITYDVYRRRFENIINELGLDKRHRPHDGRKHFITAAKEAGMDEYAIKRIVGHAIRDVTERVYTERNNEWLTKEIEKIN